MGNAGSSQREGNGQRSTRDSSELAQGSDQQGRTRRNTTTSGHLRTPTLGSSISAIPTGRRRSNVYGTFRRQVSSQSMPLQPDDGHPLGTDEVVFEQEERPLVNMEDLRMRDAPITHIAATPLMRRTSTMSRLGSRFLPNSVLRGLQSTGEETPAEGRAHRQGGQGRLTRAAERRISGTTSGRFSLRESLRSRNSSRPGIRRHSMRGPFPADPLLQDSTRIPDFNDASRPAPSPMSETPGEGSWRRRARFARNSLSFPLSSMFSRSPDRSSSSMSGRATPSTLSRSGTNNASEHILPPLSHLDHSLDLGNSEQSSRRGSTLEVDQANMQSSSGAPASNGPSTSGLRRFPHGLRSRSTRIIRPREQPPLAQVLHLAASAIAAQLSGHTGSNVSNMQPLGGNGFDGTIQSFVQTLQQAASAQARGNGDHAEGEDGNLPPVNFLRVFQFPNSESGSNGANGAEATRTSTHGSDRMDVDQPNGEDRTVTLVLVGVRSMPHGETPSGEEGAGGGPSLDALLNLPFLPPTNLLRNGSSGALLRRSDNRTRFSSRRNSMSNFSSFPQQYDSQRHHRTRSSTTRSQADGMPIMSPQSTIPSVLSESPPGPVPPPSTPAPLSGQSTPNRRPSSASALHATNLPDLSEEALSAGSHVPPNPDASHYRRRSDSEFARRPELSSGATRRNGVVEPDTPPASTGGRSWLIYVVGTNVSPDHPAFTMPSLFTDNPSYEDMQLLSSMLGPVKPPVATQADVTSSGGLYRLIVDGPTLVAQPQSEGLAPLSVQIGDRCLICLCDYENTEEIRQLSKCSHIYHRECIDEWLTTGRNSCPLCRGQGVGENASGSQTPASTSPAV